MKIHQYRISNFKSIKEFTSEKNSDSIACFIGQNDSGKSNHLLALYRFSPESSYILEEDWMYDNLSDPDANHIVCSVDFLLENNEITQLLEALPKVERYKFNIELSKLFKARKDYQDKLFALQEQKKILSSGLSDNEPDQTEITQEEVEANLETKIEALSHGIGQLNENIKETDRKIDALEITERDLSNIPKTLLVRISKKFNNEYLVQIKYDIKDDGHFEEELVVKENPELEVWINKVLPKFIYVDEEKTLPGRMDLTALKTRNDNNSLDESDKKFLDFLRVASLSLDDLTNTPANVDTFTHHSTILLRANGRLNDGIAPLWEQSYIRFDIRKNDKFLTIFIEDIESGKTIPFDRQAKGFKWFFTFVCSWYYRDDEQLVLLLDEPGKDLHCDAQRNLLTFLDKIIAKEEQQTVYYTTHSIYTVDLMYPERIQVLFREKGTTVVKRMGQVYRDGYRIPLIEQALGLTPKDAGFLQSRKNLVVEGKDDELVFDLISKLLNKEDEKEGLDERIYIHAATGASKIPTMIKFMDVHDLTVLAVLDSDKAGREAKEKVEKNKFNKDKVGIKSLLKLLDQSEDDKSDFALEDLFPEEFYFEKTMKAHNHQFNFVDYQTHISGNGYSNKQVIKRIKSFFGVKGVDNFDKESTMTLIIKYLEQWDSIDDLLKDDPRLDILIDQLKKIFAKINEILA